MCFYYTENKTTTTKISVKQDNDNDNDNKHPVRRSKSKNFVCELKLDKILN